MPASGDVLRFPGTLPGFAAAAASLRALLDAWHLHDARRNDIEVAFEEIAINIVRYGSSRADIEVGVALDGDEVVLTFVDDGVAFDPCRRENPTLPLALDDAKVGGLGILLVKKLANRMDYERTAEGRNHLTVSMPAH